MRLLSRFSLGVTFIVLLTGCAIKYYGRSLPPAESDWTKPGVSLSNTKDILYGVCNYPTGYRLENFNDRVAASHRCMLDNGFEFMEGGHNIEDQGYLPLDPGDICFARTKGFLYSMPGCQSYREKHPGGKSWFRRILGLY